jgi:hypothetical protein
MWRVRRRSERAESWTKTSIPLDREEIAVLLEQSIGSKCQLISRVPLFLPPLFLPPRVPLFCHLLVSSKTFIYCG